MRALCYLMPHIRNIDGKRERVVIIRYFLPENSLLSKRPALFAQLFTQSLVLLIVFIPNVVNLELFFFL
ncbi:MAG: hypothetical protein JWL75_361 [Parcubacteria group bacterium]|nr:hypothetical protein [Parcubacteria group bacterium]